MLSPAQMRELSLKERVETGKSNVTVEEIDEVLTGLTNQDLINFWLDVRLDIANKN